MGPYADASALLRPGLLDGTSVVVFGSCAGGGSRASAAALGESALGAAVVRACESLGANVGVCAHASDAGADPERTEQDIDAAIAGAAGPGADALVVDADALFASASAEAASAQDARSEAASAHGEPLRASMLACWAAARALAARDFIGAGEEAGAPASGRIVLLAPRADGRAHAGAATAGLENLARTLSIEWARYAITAVALAPGADTPAGEVAAVTAYLLSPAGAYFSGCLLDLRGARARER